MQLMKGVEGAPKAELCLEASANLPVGGPGAGRGCRNEMRTGNEAKQKRSSRGPREAPHRAAQQAGAPAPRANVWSAQRNSSPFLKLRPNGDPLFPVLNFPLQQFSFCLFQKKGRITFY